MKNLVKVGILSFLMLAAFSACSSDNNYSYDYFFSYGNILADEGGIADGYSITLDDGDILTIKNNFVSGADVEDGERVYAQYTVIGEKNQANGKKEYIVDLYGLSQVLVKYPILQSEIGTPDNPTEESIGNDPIKPTLVLVGGKYLTVEFWVYTRRGSDVKHLISLVEDNTRVPQDPNDKTVYLTLRHNGYQDVPEPNDFYQFVRTYGNISFDITSIIPQGETSVPIRLMWTEYGRTLADREEFYITRTYNYTPQPQPIMQAASISSSGSQVSKSYSTPYLIK